MRSPAAAVVLVAGLLAVSSCAGAAARSANGGSASLRQGFSVFRRDGVSFRYPSAWKRMNWCWEGMEAAPLVVLTTAPSAPTCNRNTAFPPAQRLRRDGVSVWWEQSSLPLVPEWMSTVKGSPTGRVGGKPARTATIEPRSSNWSATGCGRARGDLAMFTQIRRDAYDDYVLATACLRGPHFANNRRAVRKMLASVRFTK
jgi:hypothetical protein